MISPKQQLLFKKFLMRKKLINILLGIVTVGVINSPVIAAPKITEYIDLEVPHWAYKAIQQCLEKYQIMEGFPDKTFKGAQNITRYEAAAAFYKIMLRTEQLVRQNMVNQEDLKLLKDLQQEFKKEIESLKRSTPNVEQAEKITNLEKELEKVKSDIGTLRFGGSLSASMEDVIQDTFRPTYETKFGIDMKIVVSEKVNVYSSWGGKFSSKIEEKKEEGKPPTKEAVTKSSLEFGDTCLEYNHGGFLSPTIQFGYKKWDLIKPDTSIPNKFDGAISLASPNLSSDDRKRGIRKSATVILGGSISEGPFSLSLLTTPDIFAGQVEANFGLVKLKLVADADQSHWLGEIVQDPMHNEIVILDLGDGNFGIALQGACRGLGNKFNFKSSSVLINTSFLGFTIGGAAKYEKEAVEQVIIGGYFQTPSKWGDIRIPQFLIGMQEPLTIQGGTIYEGSLLKDKAGLLVELSYDNPIIPNLSIKYSVKSEILIPPQSQPPDPRDAVEETITIITHFDF